MLEWTTTGPGPRFGLLVHHDDAEREWAYDRNSPFGELDRGLDEGPARGWIMVSMKRDWNQVFPDGDPFRCSGCPDEESPNQASLLAPNPLGASLGR
jgi:hypothetical protein